MIRATITDEDAIKQIGITSVIFYFLNHGWEVISSTDLGMRLENQKYDDIIPIAMPECGDYVRRLSQAIELLGKLENRSCLDIFIEMGGDIASNEEDKAFLDNVNSYFDEFKKSCCYSDSSYEELLSAIRSKIEHKDNDSIRLLDMLIGDEMLDDVKILDCEFSVGDNLIEQVIQVESVENKKLKIIIESK